MDGMGTGFVGGTGAVSYQKDYRYALVTGPTREYLWILSRTPQMKDTTLSELKAKARELGYDTEKLIMVPQGGMPEVEATEGR